MPIYDKKKSKKQPFITVRDRSTDQVQRVVFPNKIRGSILETPGGQSYLVGGSGINIRSGSSATALGYGSDQIILESPAETFSNVPEIGIGTTAPDKKLEINAGGSANGIRLTWNDSNGSASDYAEITVEDTNGSLKMKTVDSDGASGHILLAPDGYVGIGTTGPERLLHVNGGLIKIGSENDTNTEFARLEMRANSQSNNVQGFIDVRDNSSSNFRRLQVGTQSNHNFAILTNDTTRVTIENSGKVGIGTSSPEGMLSIYGDGNVTGVPALYLDGYDASELDISVGNGQQIQFGEWDGSSATLNAKIAANGDWFTNDGTTHSLSDERVKENIQTLNDCLAPLLGLRPVKFDYNGKGQIRKDMPRQAGFIAQEVELVLPEIVSEDSRADNDEEDLVVYKAMAQGKLIPYLVGAIQELHQKIDNLQTELDNLKNV